MKVVFTVGRFNPPTRGHEVLMKNVVDLARKNRAHAIVFTTITHDKKKNPLKTNEKLHYLRKFFPGIKFLPTENAYTAAQMLGDMGYENALFVGGSDRMGLRSMFNRGMQNKDENKKINLSNIQMFELKRDEKRSDIQGLSGTKVRNMVLNNNYEEFKQSVPKSNEAVIQNLYYDIQNNLRG